MLKFLPAVFLLQILCSGSQSTGRIWSQKAFERPIKDIPDADSYNFKWPIRKVAIIGAGPSGMISYREFTQAGFEVRVFERDSVPGGNWHYTDETPVDAPIPNADAVVGDYVPSLPPDGVEFPYSEEYLDDGSDNNSYFDRRREHRGPKPIWKSLTSNVPSPYQQISELPWPAGTEWELTHYRMRNYLRSFASFHGINSNDDNFNISYHTRVEHVEKHVANDGQERGWILTLKKFVKTGSNSSKATWWTERFDAVVVATGRFNAPYIPPIPGLSEWAKRFPGQISHSRQYRRPEQYLNETILIVGAASSGGEISRDLNPFAKKIYQSIRPDNSSGPQSQRKNLLLRRLPRNTTVVPEIKCFHTIVYPNESLSKGRIELVNGTIITGIDRIFFATGFRYSFPFLPRYHNSSIAANETATGAALQPLVTDGTHIRSLHLDLFYIAEPTIAFINMNFGMQSETYAEYLSLALAKVWDNKAKLPSTEEMWRLHRARVDEYGGYGKHFQYLGVQATDANVRYFVGWLNDAAVKYGGKQINGLPIGNEEILKFWAIARFGSDMFLGGKGLQNGSFDSIHDHFRKNDGNYPVGSDVSDEKKRELIFDSIFHDFW